MVIDVHAYIDEKGGTTSGLKDVVLFKNLWPYIRPHQKGLWFSIMLLIPMTFAQVSLPLIVKQAIDGPIREGNPKALLGVGLLYLTVMVVHYIVRYHVMVLSQSTGQQIIYDLRTHLYRHLQTLSLRFYHKTPIGKLVTRITNDVENLTELFSSGGLTILIDLAVIIAVLGVMALIHWPMMLAVLVMVAAILVVIEFLRRHSRHQHDQIRLQVAAINAYLQENLSGMDVVQLYRREEKNLNDFRALNQHTLKTSLSSVFYDCSMAAWAEFLMILTQVAVLAIGGIAIAQGVMTIGLLVAFFIYVQMIFEPIEDLADKYTIIQSGLASVDKIMALFNEQPDLVEKDVEKEKIVSPQQSPAALLPIFPSKSASPDDPPFIGFDHVTFGYLPDHPILHDIRFDIAAGSTVAIVGPTGSGKTTITKLLTRFYDVWDGRILLNGCDVRDIPLTSLRRQMVVIQQDDVLFSRTLAENITLDPTLANDRNEHDRIWQALTTVGADRFAHRLEGQLGFTLEENGKNLSAGERQLLLFARAVYHEPAVLILDEATSAIDPYTEQVIQRALRQLMRGRTVLVIAHRLSTVEHADCILVMHQGRLVEKGTHQELIAQDGLYAKYSRYDQALKG